MEMVHLQMSLQSDHSIHGNQLPRQVFFVLPEQWCAVNFEREVNIRRIYKISVIFPT
jgi:hypothetical protein